MTPQEWLRAIEVWSPFVRIADPAFTKEECIEAIGDALARNFPLELFCEATVRVAVRHCETFPNYYWCCRVLEGWL